MRAFKTLAGIILLIMGCRPATPPAEYGQIPPFQMTAVTTDKHFPVTRDSLSGNPWVADFIFTNCAGPCPLMSARMARLQRMLPAHVRLISFSIDPERDSTAVLQAYAKTFQADPKRWWFVRGGPGQTERLAVEGFKLGVTQNPDAPSGMRFTHSTKFVLVDSSGTIRGYYDSHDEAFALSLKQDIEKL